MLKIYFFCTVLTNEKFSSINHRFKFRLVIRYLLSTMTQFTLILGVIVSCTRTDKPNEAESSLWSSTSESLLSPDASKENPAIMESIPLYDEAPQNMEEEIESHEDSLPTRIFKQIYGSIVDLARLIREYIIRFLRFILGLLEPTAENGKQSVDETQINHVKKNIDIQIDSFDFIKETTDGCPPDETQDDTEEEDNHAMSDSELHSKSTSSVLMDSLDVSDLTEPLGQSLPIKSQRRRSATCLSSSVPSPAKAQSPKHRQISLEIPKKKVGKANQRKRSTSATPASPHYAEPTISSLNMRSPKAFQRTPDFPSRGKRTGTPEREKAHDSRVKNRRYNGSTHKELEKRQRERARYVDEIKGKSSRD